MQGFQEHTHLIHTSNCGQISIESPLKIVKIKLVLALEI